MKKLLFGILPAMLLGLSQASAQNPEAIYIGTWVTMDQLGTPITPDSNDPMLTYNSTTGCYEGEVIDWPRMVVNPYNAKIPYSVEGNVITYYGEEGTTQQFNFNNSESATFHFTASTDPSGFKGYGLSPQNAEGVADVKISMNLTTNEITFTKFESGEGEEIPVLLAVDPENGSEVTPDEDGLTITLTFSGKVTSLEALCNGNALSAEPESEGSVWSIFVSADRISDIAK